MKHISQAMTSCRKKGSENSSHLSLSLVVYLNLKNIDNVCNTEKSVLKAVPHMSLVSLPLVVHSCLKNSENHVEPVKFVMWTNRKYQGIYSHAHTCMHASMHTHTHRNVGINICLI